jgi:hypothetical protein
MDVGDVGIAGPAPTEQRHVLKEKGAVCTGDFLPR